MEGSDQSFYDLAWARAGDLPESEQLRIEATLALVPPGTQSVLDAGCGDGRIINRLGHLKAVGMDFSVEALRRVTVPSVHGDVTRLPFAAGAHDLVLCCEVLEHLEDAALGAAVAELRRVARRHILITVPSRECLLECSTRCNACGMVYNAHRHVQTFTRRRLCRLLAPFRLVRASFVGPRPVSARRLLFLTRYVGGKWPRLAGVCPGCGSTDNGGTAGNGVAWLAERVYWRWARLPWRRTQAHWMCALFQRLGEDEEACAKSC